MKVQFVEASDDQVLWGRGDDPRDFLSVGGIYTVSEEEVRAWVSVYVLKEVPGRLFNSVHFKTVEDRK